MSLNIYRFFMQFSNLKAFHRFATEYLKERYPNFPNYENFLKATNKSFPMMMLFVNSVLAKNREKCAGETILSEMAEDGIFMHNAPRKNMTRLISKEQLDCLEQRNIIETVRSVMKGRFELVYTKARSLKGMFRHFFYNIAAFLISQSACRQKLFISD